MDDVDFEGFADYLKILKETKSKTINRDKLKSLGIDVPMDPTIRDILAQFGFVKHVGKHWVIQ
jgi:hypothetical protein